MEFKLNITMADPAGNRTAFVEGDVPPEQYAAVGAALLKETDLRAEQGGFVCPPLSSGIGRLEMMGGEFCGNAARSFGLWMGLRTGKKAGDIVPIEISGSHSVLNVTLEEHGSWISMPLPQKIITIEVGGSHYPAVVLEGITHVILEHIEPSEELAHAVIAEATKQTDSDAAGAIFIDGDRMTPAVWVRAAGSFFWESSCGSGTLAATIWLGREVKDGTYSRELIQPGGILKANFTVKDGKFLDAQIGGPVCFEEPIVRTITLP
ncbi:MAG: hypothetical protein RSE05_01920 [Clostridium sp.]